MSTKPKKKLTALGMSKLTVPQLLNNANHYVACITANGYFLTPSPALASIAAQLGTLQTAYNLALTKAHGSAGAMRTEERKLVILLKGLASYVETIANGDTDHASEIIASSGMPEKKSVVHKPKTFTALPGKLKGSVNLNTKAVKGGSAYIYQMNTDPTNVANWVTVYTGTKVKFTKTGLTSATHAYFRVAVSTKGLQADWSNVLDVVVP
jgi:hypothetical protein